MWQIKKEGPWKVPVTVTSGDTEVIQDVTVYEYYTIYDPITREYIYTSSGENIKQYESFSMALQKCAELILKDTTGVQHASE